VFGIQLAFKTHGTFGAGEKSGNFNPIHIRELNACGISALLLAISTLVCHSCEPWFQSQLDLLFLPFTVLDV
jgi:hypothetical protein